MVGCLFRYIVGMLAFVKVPITGKDLSQDRVQGFLHATVTSQYTVCWSPFLYLRWTDMPTAKVKLDNRNEALGRVVDRGNVQEQLRVTHETAQNDCQYMHEVLSSVNGNQWAPTW